MTGVGRGRVYVEQGEVTYTSELRVLDDRIGQNDVKDKDIDRDIALYEHETVYIISDSKHHYLSYYDTTQKSIRSE